MAKRTIRISDQSKRPLTNSRTATVGIIGLGYVGLPVVTAFAEAGFKVVGIDIDAQKVKALNRGESYIEDVPFSRIAEIQATGLFSTSTGFGELTACDAVSICVPTPLRKTRDPDISYVLKDAEEVGRHIQAGRARRRAEWIELHYLPKRGSWLNIAECELSALGMQCLNLRMPDISTVQAQLNAWETDRNNHQTKVNWQFTEKDACIRNIQKFKCYVVLDCKSRLRHATRAPRYEPNVRRATGGGAKLKFETPYYSYVEAI